MNPKHPIYIVSKGRWESRLTSKELHRIGVPHYIVIEQQEYPEYARTVDSSATLLILDKKYQEEYDTWDDFGDTKSKGPGPARNFAWQHSIDNNHTWHWVMDDNIRAFYRFNRNMRISIADGTIFYCMEDFVERYENIGMAGPQYTMFIPRKSNRPPFTSNTRIYSCNLIRNDLAYRWRGRYNEDTDLSLRMLKDKWCTVLFYAFLQEKIATQKVKGGNTAEFYDKEGTLPKSRMQVELHPDISRLMWRFGRAHHYVDYSGFTHRLRLRKDIIVPNKINEFNMVYERKINDEWISSPVLFE